MCKKCKIEHEIYVSVSDSELKDSQVCPTCGHSVERVLFNANINFGDAIIKNSESKNEDTKDSYRTVKKRLGKEIEERRRDLKKFQEEVRKEMDEL